MTKASSSIIIQKPIGDIFEYMASPHHGPAFIPNLNENTNISPKENGRGQKFDWRFNMAGVDLKGKAEVIEFTPPTKVVISSKGDADSTWTYRLEESGTGTKVSAEVDYELSANAMQRFVDQAIISKLAQKTTEQMLENLKTILET